MKTVYFVRHAKSSWSNPQLSDHDRPLNKRGIRDAPRMATLLRARGANPRLMLSSTARRARDTAEVFRKEFDLPAAALQLEGKLYHAYPTEIAAVLQTLPDDIDSLALFAHNPGLTDLANQLDPTTRIDNVPTTGIVASRCPVERWTDWTAEAAQRTHFWYPKLVFGE